MPDKAHVEILEIISELSEDVAKKHKEVQRDFQHLIRLNRLRFKDLEKEHGALKAWTEESLGKIHQR